MKKFIIILLCVIILLVGGAYFILFTQPGNNILKPIIQSKVAQKTGVNINISQFTLRPSNLYIKLNGLDAFETEANINFSIFGGDINGTINNKIIDFSKLEKFTKRKLTGKCNININLSGNYKNNLIINIDSDIFKGSTKIKIVKAKDKLKSLYYQLKNIKISEILKFLNMGNYAKGFLDSFGNFDFYNNKGNGKTLFTGNFIGKNIYKDFQVKLPYTKFKGEILNTFKDRIIFTTANIYSTLANIFLTKTKFYLKDNSLNSHYLIKIPKLSVFNELAEKNLKGYANIEGDLKYNTNIFTKGIMKINNNKFFYTFKKPELNVYSDNFDSIDILKTLSYPAIFKTIAKLNLNYNLSNKKGVLDINFDKGLFGNTALFRTIKKFTGVDITIEVYRNGYLKTLINNKILNSEFDLKSKKTEFSSKNLIIDLNKQNINGKVDANILGALIHIFLSGNLNKPDIKTDIADIFKHQLINNLNIKKDTKKIEKNIKKKIKNLKGLFNNFK